MMITTIVLMIIAMLMPMLMLMLVVPIIYTRNENGNGAGLANQNDFDFGEQLLVFPKFQCATTNFFAFSFRLFVKVVLHLGESGSRVVFKAVCNEIIGPSCFFGKTQKFFTNFLLERRPIAPSQPSKATIRRLCQRFVVSQWGYPTPVHRHVCRHVYRHAHMY